MENPEFREPHFEILHEFEDSVGVEQLGLIANHTWNADPKKLAIMMSRYKFVAKMFDGFSNVLEVGCGDAFATRIVQQSVQNMTVSDVDPIFLDNVKSRVNPLWPMEIVQHDMTKESLGNEYDGVFAVDVFEHIPPKVERDFLGNICDSMSDNGVLILGIPSLESQQYAKPENRIGHVNCKTGSDFRSLLQEFFHNVFTFSMNDEVVHTGYFPMAHYLFSVCCAKR
jgi:predicted TPR repeat methyltransferase